VSKSQIIEINGRQYDTRSGAVLHKSNDSLRSSDSKKSSKSISVSAEAALPPTISEENNVVVSHGPKKNTHHKVAKPAAAHKRQKAKTLVRQAVKKPSFKSEDEEKRLGKVSSAIASSFQSEEGGKGFVVRDTADRVLRAGQVSKSAAVHKFNDLINPEANVKKIEVKRVAAPPEPTKSFTSDVVPPPKPVEKVNPFDTAVERSKSHEQTLPRPPLFSFSRLSGQFLVMAILFVVVSAFVLDMKSQALAINLSAYQAKVPAVVPTYIPQGYTLQNPIYHKSGQVIMLYSNGVNAMALTESNSPIDSTDLLALDVAPSGSPYTQVSANQQPVFVFSDGSAVWTVKGVLFQLTTNSPLPNSEVQSIATSTV
jgi:hypothetical protein